MYHSAKAFTLIELIVVISIITLFTGLSVTGYVNMSRQKGLEEDAELLVSRLEIAREYALTRNVQGDDTCELQGYAVTMPLNGTDYALVRRCEVNGTPVPPVTLDQFNLSVSLISTINPAPAEVFFQYPLGVSSANKEVVIRSERLGQCIRITIQQHSAITNTQPYAC